jgi:hypothetical protein
MFEAWLPIDQIGLAYNQSTRRCYSAAKQRDSKLEESRVKFTQQPSLNEVFMYLPIFLGGIVLVLVVLYLLGVI